MALHIDATNATSRVAHWVTYAPDHITVKQVCAERPICRSVSNWARTVWKSTTTAVYLISEYGRGPSQRKNLGPLHLLNEFPQPSSSSSEVELLYHLKRHDLSNFIHSLHLGGKPFWTKQLE